MEYNLLHIPEFNSIPEKIFENSDELWEAGPKHSSDLTSGEVQSEVLNSDYG